MTAAHWVLFHKWPYDSATFPPAKANNAGAAPFDQINK